MDEYKHIETCIGRYIADNYSNAVEIGIGRNTDAARIIADAGNLLCTTDIRNMPVPEELGFIVDDIFSPDLSRYRQADVIYSVRPGIEMVPSLIALAGRLDCDLIVYHLGFETYENGGERIDCGVILHRYHRCSKTIKQR
ncbi:MAG: hypothetical protein EHM53_06045 [Methanoregulaceae archaeon]|nr:MAG: hypothetical protein EHM53_06045 [Methanoregulaceae archaeon]